MRHVNLALLVAFVGTFVVGVVVDAGRRVDVVEHEGVIGGAVERCQSCHPKGATAEGGADGQGGEPHPRIPGHATLDKLGCVVCHGGDGRRVDAVASHRPRPGEGHPPFFPRPYFEVGCARCHVIGRLEGAERLARGQREYVASACVGCHLPGGRPGGLGFDLRHRPARTVDYIRRHLLDPNASSGRGQMMWTLRDATYRGQFADTPKGRQALEALIAYLLALGESPEPYRARWARPELRVDGKCGDCHRMGGAAPTGASHACPALTKARAAELACERCHGSAATAPKDRAAEARCPQLRAAYPLCNTCHLRPGDGATKLLER